MLIFTREASALPEALLLTHISLIKHCGFASLTATIYESLIETDSLIFYSNCPGTWLHIGQQRKETDKTK